MTKTPKQAITTATGAAGHHASDKALLFDYRAAANPVRPGLTEPIPYCSWGPSCTPAAPAPCCPSI